MYSSPVQRAFQDSMVNLGVARGTDLSTGDPNVVSFFPFVSEPSLDRASVRTGRDEADLSL